MLGVMAQKLRLGDNPHVPELAWTMESVQGQLELQKNSDSKSERRNREADRGMAQR